MAPRWRKALADIAVRPGRSALAVLAMAIGIAAIGTLAFKQALLAPVLGSMHGDTAPASATLYLDAVDDELVETVRRVPGVGDAEARPVIMARIRVGPPGDAEWIPAFLYVIRDFEGQRMSRIEPDSGPWPPADDEVLLERTAVRVAGAAPDAALPLRIPGAGERTLRFSGTAYAAGLAPAWMEHVVYGFVPWSSAVRAGGRESAQLLIRVAEHGLEEGHIREVAARVRAEVEARGRIVRRVEVPEPGRHPHAAQMETFLYLVGSFGLMAFLLSTVLAASMIHALQSEQVRQVGVMKAVGATTRQISGVYLAHVGTLALAALALGLPAGWFAGSAYARFSAGILNADLSRSPFPYGALFAVAAAGLLVPLLTALVPVWRASRITVREALAEDAGARPPAADPLTRRIAAIAWLPRPQLAVLRSALARRGRLVLTAGMLAIGGAMWMAALNASAAWNRAADEDAARRRYDLTVWLAAAQPVEELDRLFAAAPGVVRAEYWPGVTPWLIGPGGAPGREVTLLGVDPASRLLEPRLLAGRWLDPDRPDGAVINHAILAMHPSLGVGDTVRVRHAGRTLAFPVIGVVKELLPQPIVYAPRARVIATTGVDAGVANIARVVTRAHDPAGRRAAARAIETSFPAAGIEVARIFRADDMKAAILDHLVIIQVILMLSAGIVVLVGAIGLASALGIGVVQRTRELGVMGAIGATPRMLAAGVWLEAMLIAALSWLAAGALTVPVSWALQAVTGRMFFRAPLDLTLSPGAAAIWLALVAVLATLASVQPCLRAARLTVREAIAHV